MISLDTFRRHPVPVVSHFRHSLVLTYALPVAVLQPMVPPGLVVDSYEDLGFVAIAMVDVRSLRPAHLPEWSGRSYFLTGYRIFVRHRSGDGRLLRGLHILRSDTNRRSMKLVGNALTHYRYTKSDIDWTVTNEMFAVDIRTPDARADLHVTADLTSIPAALPPESPFIGTNDSRRFAGPLPWTFDYEAHTHSIVKIRGRREQWVPQPVSVNVETCTFFDQPAFSQFEPVLANAFYVKDLPYRWDRGIRTALTAT